MKHDDLLDKVINPIHVQSYELGPHKRKVIFLPKPSVFDNSNTKIVWVLASLVIGVSLTSSAIDLSKSIFTFSKSKIVAFANKGDVILVDNTSQDQNPLGSDDVPLAEATSSKPVVGSYFQNDKNTIEPKITALSYLVADIDKNIIIKEKSSELILPIASISKIITALVAKEYLKLHDYVVVTRSSVDTYGTFGGLKVGEKILITDLLYPLLIESSNDAAEVLAYGLGREEFIDRMNIKAKELGLYDTSFDDPSGLSENNVSTAKDLLTLARYVTSEKPDIWDITRIRQYSILKHSWTNGNRLVLKQSFVGGKNGYTEEANRTTISIFEVSVLNEDTKIRESKRIAIILLKSADRDSDINKLLRYVENNIRYTEQQGSIEDFK